MWARILSLIVKELLALMRDPRGRMVLIAPPLIQLFVFTFAATLEVAEQEPAQMQGTTDQDGAIRDGTRQRALERFAKYGEVGGTHAEGGQFAEQVLIDIEDARRRVIVGKCAAQPHEGREQLVHRAERRLAAMLGQSAVGQQTVGLAAHRVDAIAGQLQRG